MKTVVLIRHAKSSWDNIAASDIERPLNDRGKKNAPEMARRLIDKGVKLDALLSSPAKRAKTTAEYFADAHDISRKRIVVVPELYLATRDAFVHAIRNAPGTANTIAVFSHNNGISEFANSLSDTRIDHMPTCAMFAVNCDISDWLDFMPASNNFYFFDYPKSK